MSDKLFPKRVRFIIADDVRSETTKPMIIGLYLDDIVVIEMPTEQPDPSKEAPITLQSLSILTSFIHCKGVFDANVSLYLPSGTPVFENQKIEGGVTSGQGEGAGNINFVARFMPFGISEFGQYRFVINLDEHEHKFHFSIIRKTQQ